MKRDKLGRFASHDVHRDESDVVLFPGGAEQHPIFEAPGLARTAYEPTERDTSRDVTTIDGVQHWPDGAEQDKLI